MKIAALASGSDGNCFYINNGDSSVIVDSGISCKRVIHRLNYLGEDPSKIKGIFVTHEHTDHVKGVDVLARKLNIPVFATRGTINNCFLCSDKKLINEINNHDLVKLAGLEVEAFSKPHDAADPVSFAIRNGKMISILTDIGHASKNVIGAVKDSDFLIMETNHDLKMLQEGPYPYSLKRRIDSEIGHFSNFNSAACVLEHSNSKLKNVMLAHLSEINNTPLLAFNTFNNMMKERVDLNPRLSLSLKGPTSLLKV
jgi:phosphoribosyl 1,2-cyclic phosphodiesterase